jgi:hypothetical protein
MTAHEPITSQPPAIPMPKPEPIERQRIPTLLRDAARLIERELHNDTRKDACVQWTLLLPECAINVIALRGDVQVVAIQPAEASEA